MDQDSNNVASPSITSTIRSLMSGMTLLLCYHFSIVLSYYLLSYQRLKRPKMQSSVKIIINRMQLDPDFSRIKKRGRQRFLKLMLKSIYIFCLGFLLTLGTHMLLTLLISFSWSLHDQCVCLYELWPLKLIPPVTNGYLPPLQSMLFKEAYSLSKIARNAFISSNLTTCRSIFFYAITYVVNLSVPFHLHLHYMSLYINKIITCTNTYKPVSTKFPSPTSSINYFSHFNLYFLSKV